MKDFFEKILGLGNENTASTRRRHHRQPGQNSVVTIAGRTFPVEDWSQGGLLIGANSNDSGQLAIGDTFSFILKFKLPHDTVSIEHKGRVIRTSRQGIAAEFAPMTQAVKRQFGRVIDSVHTLNFSESQAAA